MSRAAVRYTEEFQRVESLPRRRLSQADAEAMAEILTPEMRAKGSMATVRPWQAMAIVEVIENNGGFLALPVGLGKTLLCDQLGRMMNKKRVLLIVPTSLKDKTKADFASYIGVWRRSNPPPVIKTIHDLQRKSMVKFLDKYKPDLIIIDEADDLQNPKSSMCRKLDRYIVANRKHVAVVCMTGTPSRKSIMNYWHLLCWCLDDRAPVPLNVGEARMWGAALDDYGPKWKGNRPDPGPLGDSLGEAREWFRVRLLETPGVVIVDGDSCDQPLTINVILAKEDPLLDKHFKNFLVDFENPDGITVSDPLSRWRMDTRLGAGYYDKWDPAPPDEWREAKRALAKFVREEIDLSTHTGMPLDTEGEVIRANLDHPIVEEWLAVKDTFKEKTKPVWLSTSTLESAAEWLAESDEPSIVWVGGVEFAEALSYITKLPYFGPKGKDQQGRGLYAAKAERIPKMVVSWHANKKGLNLQAWRRHLIVMPPQSAKWLEQLFGRSHRSMQDQPVRFYILGTSGGVLDGFDAAISEARFAKGTISLTQKILRSKITRQKPKLTKSNRFRWAQR